MDNIQLYCPVSVAAAHDGPQLHEIPTHHFVTDRIRSRTATVVAADPGAKTARIERLSSKAATIILFWGTLAGLVTALAPGLLTDADDPHSLTSSLTVVPWLVETRISE
ncbi:MAG TPA: hypothetical protein VEX88_02460 [Glaciibacter sp.]|nr:hypothetical protein [Glaciibacter sp.]